MAFTAYFDQNIWGRLTMDVFSNERERMQLITKAIAEKRLSIVYSMPNITETLARPVDKSRNMEFALMKLVTNDMIISETGEIKHMPVVEVIKTLGENREWLNQLMALFSPFFSAPTGKHAKTADSAPWESVDINNVPGEDIFKHLQQIAEGTPEFTWSKPNVDETVAFVGAVLEKLRNNMPELLRKIPGLENLNVKSIQKEIDMSIDAEKEKIAENASKVEKFSFENPEVFLKSLGVENSQLPGATVALLEAAKYWPDRQKLKDKKGQNTDLQDAAHVNHAQFVDVFVTDDRALRERAKAAFIKFGTKTEVLSLSGFLRTIERR